MLSSLDINTAEGEARAVHAYSQGWFAVLSKFPEERSRQQMFKMDMLDDVVRALDRAPDTYLSQASFAAKARRVSALSTLGCAFVDLDCYKLGIVPDEHLVSDLMAEAADAGMPVPSYVTYSGRGLYLKWLFDAPVPAIHLHRWRALQSVLVPMFRAFGADVVAKDAARYLRVVGTINTAGQGRRVAQLWRSDKRYNFDDLCQAAAAVDMSEWQPVSRTVGERLDTSPILLPGKTSGPDGAAGAVKRLIAGRQKRLLLSEHELSETQVRQAHAAGLANLDAYARSREPIMLEAFSRRSLAWRRFIDLRDLAMSRQGIPRGSRDIHLFWMLNFLAQAGVVNEANFEEEAKQLSSSFVGADFKPLKDGSMSTIRSRIFNFTQGTRARAQRALASGKPTPLIDEEAPERSSKQRPLYNPSNDFLIELFEISPAEQQRLATLIGADEKQRRSDLKAPGRAERREARQTWRALATQLAETDRQAGETPSVTRIAEAVGVHKSMVSRLLAGKLGAQPGQRSYVRRRSSIAPGSAECSSEALRRRDANPFAQLAASSAARNPRRPGVTVPTSDRMLGTPVEQGAHIRSEPAPFSGRMTNPFAKLAAKSRRVQTHGEVPWARPAPPGAAAPAHHDVNRQPLPGRMPQRPSAGVLRGLDSVFPKKIPTAQTAFVGLPVAELSVDRKEIPRELDWASKGNAFGLHSAFNAGGHENTRLVLGGPLDSRSAPPGPGSDGAPVIASMTFDVHQRPTARPSGPDVTSADEEITDPALLQLEEAAEQVRLMTIGEAQRRAAEREAEQQRLIAEREQRTLRALQRIEKLRTGPLAEARVPGKTEAPLAVSEQTGESDDDAAAFLLHPLMQQRPNGRT